MSTLPTGPAPSTFAVFRNRPFALLWTGQLVSTMGSALTSLAAGILVYRLTGSALSVGLMLMATAVPTLLIGLIAGVFVDRYDRRKIMIGADLLRACLVFLIPFLIQSDIAWLYVVVMLSSAVGQFYDPAHESVLPELASEEELAAANSFMAISAFGSTAVGFAASGLIASQFPIEWAFYLDAVSFLFSAACILRISIAPVVAEGETTVGTVVRNLGDGARFLFDQPTLRSLMLVSVPVFFSFGLWNVLLLPFALRALQANEFQYGVQEGMTSVGFVAGSLLMARLADRLREGQWVAIGFAGMGLTGLLYAASSWIPVAIVLVTVSGFFNAPSSVARRLLVQRNTTREVRGRVNSAFFVTRDVVSLAGMAAAGAADFFDVRALVIASAVIMVAAAGATAAVPGLGQTAAEWRRALTLLRAAGAAPGLSAGRAAAPADFDLLVAQLPTLARLSAGLKREMIRHGTIHQVDTGTVILRQGEASDAAYFVLSGRAVAGRDDSGANTILGVLNAGDFFGEIAALTGVPRTANVLAEQATTVLRVPASTLRQMMGEPEVRRLFLSRMTDRLLQMNMLDLPRFARLDQRSLQELRTPEAAEAPAGPGRQPPGEPSPA